MTTPRCSCPSITHVDDVVRGIELAADHRLTGVYNVGTGKAYDFNTVVDRINAQLGTDVRPKHVENPIHEDVYVHDTMADSSKFREATGWEPEIDFEEGIRRKKLRRKIRPSRNPRYVAIPANTMQRPMRNVGLISTWLSRIYAVLTANTHGQ